MTTTISFEKEYEKGYCVDKTVSWDIYIENGDIVKMNRSEYTITPMYTSPIHTVGYCKGETGFTDRLRRVIQILRSADRYEYNELIKALNEEAIKQYVIK